jgi:hypothetical protein
MPQIIDRKVIFSPDEIAAFNRVWPCSELRSTRAYWFEFDAQQDLVDADVPEQDDGSAAVALSQDAQRYLFDDEQPAWLR